MQVMSARQLGAFLIASQAAYTTAQDTGLSASPFAQLSFSQKEHRFDKLFDHGIYFYMLHAGTGMAFERSFISVNGAWSITDAEVSEEEETGDASRVDYDLTFGYSLSDQFTLFGGYKVGETDIDYIARETNDDGINPRYSDNYEEAGPYLGVSWQQHFGKAGRISISLAYALLDATNRLAEKGDDEEFDEDNPDEPEALELDDLNGRFKQDAKGFSIGARWTIPLSDRLSYYALFRWQQYDQDFKFEGQRFSASERFSEMGMGLSYLF